MTGLPVAAVLLAAALLVGPGPAARLPRSPRAAGSVAGRLAALPADSVIATGAAVAALLTAGPEAALATSLGAVLAVTRLRRRRRLRLRRSQGEALAAALETLVGELTVGAHPVAAFTAVSQETGGHPEAAVAAQFGAVAARARLGSDVVAGLRSAASASVVPEYWNRIAVCWQLAADHGLPMALLMRAAHRDVTDRQRFADRVEAGAAGARATAAILAGLPGVGVVLGHMVGAQPLRFLLGSGSLLLVAGVGLICAGVWWADRIIDGATR